MEDVRPRAEKYRNKAEELRAIAPSLRSLGARQLFLEMATDYIHMAEMLERLEQPKAGIPLSQFRTDGGRAPG